MGDTRQFLSCELYTVSLTPPIQCDPDECTYVDMYVRTYIRIYFKGDALNLYSVCLGRVLWLYTQHMYVICCYSGLVGV